MKPVGALLLLATLASPAVQEFQDVESITGRWTGALVIKHDGKTEEEYVHVVLKQNGDAITGTAGPDAEHQYPIRKGRLTTEKGVTTVAFEFIANGVHTVFSLKLVDGQLKGEARIEGEDGQVHLAAAELKLVK